jgi:soluble lytic murein transglycosylase
MQLLYRTARQVGRKLKIRLKRRDLFIPETNIKLGIEYLKQLIIRYKGRLPLALAAYNAGPTPVDRWIRRFGNVTPEEFIELIPYSETRTYVKNILRNYYYYKFYYRSGQLKNAAK